LTAKGEIARKAPVASREKDTVELGQFAIKSLDVVLPVKVGQGVSDLRLQTVARPERMVAELVQRLALHLPGRSRVIENTVEKVVQKTGTQNV
jgi:hypothetical protein